MNQEHKEIGYPIGFRWLHAIIGLLVVSMLTAGFFLSSLPDNIKALGYLMHKSTGLLILSLMLIRILWRAKIKAPGLSPKISKLRSCLEHSVHKLFYLFLVLMPLSGWFMSVAAGHPPSFYGMFVLNLSFIPQDANLAATLFKVHASTALILISLIIMHIIFNTMHVIYNKDQVIKRMIP